MILHRERAWKEEHHHSLLGDRPQPRRGGNGYETPWVPAWAWCETRELSARDVSKLCCMSRGRHKPGGNVLELQNEDRPSVGVLVCLVNHCNEERCCEEPVKAILGDKVRFNFRNWREGLCTRTRDGAAWKLPITFKIYLIAVWKSRRGNNEVDEDTKVAPPTTVYCIYFAC